MKIEKRDDPRTLIKIKIDYEAEGAYLYDYSHDLSEGGIFLQTDNPLEVGETINLKFILPEVLEEIETTGEVTFSNPSGVEGLTAGMGVKFVGLSEEQLAHIRDVIDKIEGGKKIGATD